LDSIAGTSRQILGAVSWLTVDHKSLKCSKAKLLIWLIRDKGFEAIPRHGSDRLTVVHVHM
jgi:hypothetical protein